MSDYLIPIHATCDKCEKHPPQIVIVENPADIKQLCSDCYSDKVAKEKEKL